MDATKIILHELEQVEQTHNVAILFSCESGSRSYGYPSANSDYDVRFVYVHPVEWYLKLYKEPDVINWKLDDQLDIVGWDLSKFLTLMNKSNATVFEWINSPYKYTGTTAIQPVCKSSCCFMNKYKLAKHYEGLAKKFLLGLEGCDTVPIKKYLYMVRCILSAMRVYSTGSIDVRLPALLDLAPSSVKESCNDMMSIRLTSDENYEIARSEVIEEYVSDMLPSLDASLTEDKNTRDDNKVNEMFLDVVNRVLW